ncbi:hypothetical protein CHLNCDRAFT_136257 [Chlorella variabilis]|uniref:Expansin-like EG45 domain-containing protein n=1 Tax=Chlorella variabilis TaxID=554065 RepID=E1ZJB7_CHLVA|nr:hypothetical protein CHLNCDRAFT_136257 [Chlorella variabilis]EFN54108.1 hypothetical protein CHLNCDRAFT_136257 [Chlorella variabilis]|eukprot:XP_005846210.1 hypothetical protein CHLNCDRAFT_136257 [Chlorella variabilis]
MAPTRAQRLQPATGSASLRLGLALAMLAATSLPQRAAAVKGISDWSPGLITHFGGKQDGMDPSSPSFGTKEGSCGYGVIPKEQYPYFSTAALAPSNKFYKADELHGCGQCFQIQCADSRGGVCKTDDAGKPLSVMVMISDECPECGTDHVDVQSLAFAKLANPDIGRITMQYRRVECAPPEDMQVSVMDFGGAGKWIRLAIDETGGRAAVKSVAVKGSGSSSWTEMTNSWGATWEHPSAPAPPLSFKIVGDDGEEVVAADVVKQNGGISGGANGERATFSSNVQFTITDPAFGKSVTAFDGPSDPMLITSDTPGADGSAGGEGASPANSSANATAPAAPSSANATAKGSPAAEGKPSSASASASSGSSGKCRDQPTPDGHSCAQQKQWGKCEQDFIKVNGYCAATCGRCGGADSGKKVQAYAGPANSGRKMLLRR